MTNYLLGIAAVNLYTVFSQSDNISMFRGASLALRDEVKLSTSFVASLPSEIKPLSVGASEGIYLLEANDQQADDIVSAVKSMLDENYAGYTFVCNVVALHHESEFLQAQTRLKNQLRLLQQKQTSLSLLNGHSGEVCSLTHLLPADTTYYSSKGDENRKVGAQQAVERFNKGRDDKQAFYRNELEQQSHNFTVKKGFTHDLQTLAGARSSADSLAYKRLTGKLAYVYLDGNKFSAIQKQVVKDIDSQISFDRRLQALRADLLASLLQICEEDEDWLATYKNEEVIRLETLLWGGDEILFVVPAWKAFDFIAHISELTEQWNVESDGTVYPLTHAVGMVLCKHGMPVYRMRELAQKIADTQKAHIKEFQSQTQSAVNGIAGIANGFDCLVLESEDFAENSMAEHFAHRYGPLAAIRSEAMPGLFKPSQLATLRQQLSATSRSQLYLLAAEGVKYFENLALVRRNSSQDSVADSGGYDPENSFRRQETRFVAVHEGISKESFDAMTGNAALLLLGYSDDLLFPASSDLKELEQADRMRALTWIVLTECIEYLMPEKEVAA